MSSDVVLVITSTDGGGYKFNEFACYKRQSKINELKQSICLEMRIR
jgi:hypothetical protein